MAAEPPIPPFKKLRYALEAAAAYAAYGLFKVLPPETASDTGGRLLRALGPRLGMSRKALGNISIAFPEKTDAEKKALVADMWENLGRVVAEYPHLDYIRDKMELVGTENIAAKKSAIFFGGHIANWEVCGLGARKYGIPLTAVYRKPNNPWVDGILKRAREEGATEHIAKGPEGARRIIAALKQGKSLGMLIDQRLNEGMPIPFFGRDALTAEAPAVFALKFGCMLYPSRVERLGPCRFRMTIYPPVAAVPTDDHEADVKRILTAMNKFLEDWIRAAPAHWLWIHNRWPKVQ